jgi:hypothetical protein
MVASTASQAGWGVLQGGRVAVGHQLGRIGPHHVSHFVNYQTKNKGLPFAAGNLL